MNPVMWLQTGPLALAQRPVTALLGPYPYLTKGKGLEGVLRACQRVVVNPLESVG